MTIHIAAEKNLAVFAGVAVGEFEWGFHIAIFITLLQGLSWYCVGEQDAVLL